MVCAAGASGRGEPTEGDDGLNTSRFIKAQTTTLLRTAGKMTWGSGALPAVVLGPASTAPPGSLLECKLSSPSPDAFLLLLISPGLCFQIPDKQYVLTALAARAKLRAWHDVDALFTTKVGALGLSALRWRCCLAIPRLLGVSGFTPPGTLRFQLLVAIFPSTFYFPKFQI